MATRTFWMFARRPARWRPLFRAPGWRSSRRRPICRRWSGQNSSTRSSWGSCSGWIRNGNGTDRVPAQHSAFLPSQPPLAVFAAQYANEHAVGGRDDDACRLALLHACDQRVERLAGADGRWPRFHHGLHCLLGIAVERLAAEATQDHPLVVDDDAAGLPRRPQAIAHVAQPVMQGAGWGVSIHHIAGAGGGGV